MTCEINDNNCEKQNPKIPEDLQRAIDRMRGHAEILGNSLRVTYIIGTEFDFKNNKPMPWSKKEMTIELYEEILEKTIKSYNELSYYELGINEIIKNGNSKNNSLNDFLIYLGYSINSINIIKNNLKINHDQTVKNLAIEFQKKVKNYVNNYYDSNLIPILNATIDGTGNSDDLDFYINQKYFGKYILGKSKSNKEFNKKVSDFISFDNITEQNIEQVVTKLKQKLLESKAVIETKIEKERLLYELQSPLIGIISLTGYNDSVEGKSNINNIKIATKIIKTYEGKDKRFVEKAIESILDMSTESLSLGYRETAKKQLLNFVDMKNGKNLNIKSIIEKYIEKLRKNYPQYKK